MGSHGADAAAGRGWSMPHDGAGAATRQERDPPRDSPGARSRRTSAQQGRRRGAGGARDRRVGLAKQGMRSRRRRWSAVGAESAGPRSGHGVDRRRDQRVHAARSRSGRGRRQTVQPSRRPVAEKTMTAAASSRARPAGCSSMRGVGDARRAACAGRRPVSFQRSPSTGRAMPRSRRKASIGPAGRYGVLVDDVQRIVRSGPCGCGPGRARRRRLR